MIGIQIIQFNTCTNPKLNCDWLFIWKSWSSFTNVTSLFINNLIDSNDKHSKIHSLCKIKHLLQRSGSRTLSLFIMKWGKTAEFSVPFSTNMDYMWPLILTVCMMMKRVMWPILSWVFSRETGSFSCATVHQKRPTVKHISETHPCQWLQPDKNSS